MTQLSWSSTDLDDSSYDSGVIHESVTYMDHDSESVLKQGYLPGGKTLTSSINNGAWGRHNGPIAVRHVGSRDQTYFGHVTNAGSIRITSYDHDTGQITSTELANEYEDDHLAPAVLVRSSDQRVIATWSGHSDTSEVFVKVSDDPEDVSSFGSAQVLNVDGGEATFTQIWEMENYGRIYLFSRDRAGDSGYRDIDFWFSDDGGSTWTGPTSLVRSDNSSHTIYWRSGSNDSDRIDIGMTYAEGGGTNPKLDVRHVYIEEDTVYDSSGTQLGTVTDSSPIIQWSDATTIFDSSATGNHCWIRDVDTNAGNPQVVYSELVSESDGYWRYAYWDGSAWIDNRIVDHGGPIVSLANDQEDYHRGDISLDPSQEGVVYYGIAPDRSTCDVYRGETTDTGSTWSQTLLSPNDGGKYIRPVVPNNNTIGPAEGYETLWLSGTYNWYKDYNTDVENVEPVVPAFSDPTLYLPLHEDSEGIAHDLSDTSSHGRPVDVTFGAPSVHGTTCYEFPSSGSPRVEAINNATDFSSAFTFIIREFQTYTSGVRQSVFTNREGNSYEMQLRISSGDTWTVANTGGSNYSFSLGPSTNTSHQIAFAYDGNGNATLYQDGQSESASGTAFNDLSNDLYIGAQLTGDGDFIAFLNGRVGEVLVFPREMTASEIQAVFDARTGPGVITTDEKVIGE